jgi:preprotein translocase subunit SecY
MILRRVAVMFLVFVLGVPTADFLDNTMTRLTLAGAVFLTAIAILPDLAGAILAGSAAWYARFLGGNQFADYGWA